MESLLSDPSGAVAVVDRDIDDAPAAVDGPDRDLGLDLEALRHDGHGLDEGAREGAVAGHDVIGGITVEQANEPSHEVVTKLMETAPVFCIVGAVGNAVAHNHVGIAIDNGRQQTDGRLGG